MRSAESGKRVFGGAVGFEVKKEIRDFLEMKNLKNQFSRKRSSALAPVFEKIDFSSFSSRENRDFHFFNRKNEPQQQTLSKPLEALQRRVKNCGYLLSSKFERCCNTNLEIWNATNLCMKSD